MWTYLSAGLSEVIVEAIQLLSLSHKLTTLLKTEIQNQKMLPTCIICMHTCASFDTQTHTPHRVGILLELEPWAWAAGERWSHTQPWVSWSDPIAGQSSRGHCPHSEDDPPAGSGNQRIQIIVYMYIRFVAAINYLYDDNFPDLWLQVPVALIAILIYTIPRSG